jgi:hypothetical protein
MFANTKTGFFAERIELEIFPKHVTFADMGGKFSKLRTYLIVTGLKMTPTI